METNNELKTILLVDDDIDFLSQTELLLSNAGYEVVTADGQVSAEKLLETTKPDLAIVDLMMEHMDGGFILAYHIKKIDPAVPIIMATAVAIETGLEFDSYTSEEKSWIKADVLLAKPIRPEQLLKEIKRLLK